MIQMYFKHLEMKMALTVAVNVCLVLHCDDYAKRRLLIIQVQACLSGRSVYKVILDVMLSLPAVFSHGNFSPYHYQRFQSPDHMAEKFEPILQMRDWGEKDWVASQGNTWHVWQEWMLDTADAVLSQNLSRKHSSFPKERKFSLGRPNDFQYLVSSCSPWNANCNN